MTAPEDRNRGFARALAEFQEWLDRWRHNDDEPVDIGDLAVYEKP